MKLLVEVQENVKATINEEADGKKNLFLEGIFMQCIPNKNKRIYPEEVMRNEVNRYVTEIVNNKRAYGELNHPQGPTINLDRVSHLIESLSIDGKNVYGRAKVLNTPAGNIVRGLIEGGANLGVSSRGLGSLKPTKNGLMEVQQDFKIITAADCVSDPSAPDAFVQAVMENTEWVFKNGDWVMVEQTQKQLRQMSNKQIERCKIRLFENYLKTL